MFLLSRRQAHAALAGAAAAATWLAAAEVGSKKPVKVSALFVLSSAALAGMMGISATHRSSVKANAAWNRLDGFIQNGGRINGDLTIGGNHTVTGNHTVNGNTTLNGNCDSHGVMDLHGATGSSCLNNLTEINKGAGGTWGAWGTLFMNGHDIVMGGGTIR